MGFQGELMILDHAKMTVHMQPASEPCVCFVAGNASAYFEIVPIHRSGITFFGDTEDYASNGHKRIDEIQNLADGLRVTVKFAVGENILHVYGYATAKPRVRARSGSIRSEDFDTVSGRYTLGLVPSSKFLAESPGGEKIRRAIVDIETADGRGPK
jgi:hypothetical protein